MKRFLQGQYSLMRTESWASLEERFDGPEERPICSLIGQIAQSRFSQGVFGTSSLRDLIIVQKPIFEFGREELRISMTPVGRVRFRYVEALT